MSIYRLVRDSIYSRTVLEIAAHTPAEAVSIANEITGKSDWLVK